MGFITYYFFKVSVASRRAVRKSKVVIHEFLKWDISSVNRILQMLTLVWPRWLNKLAVMNDS